MLGVFNPTMTPNVQWLLSLIPLLTPNVQCWYRVFGKSLRRKRQIRTRPLSSNVHIWSTVYSESRCVGNAKSITILESNIMLTGRLEISNSGQRSVAGSCKHGNESSVIFWSTERLPASQQEHCSTKFVIPWTSKFFGIGGSPHSVISLFILRCRTGFDQGPGLLMSAAWYQTRCTGVTDGHELYQFYVCIFLWFYLVTDLKWRGRCVRSLFTSGPDGISNYSTWRAWFADSK
jgi:hypothetical protein